MGGSALSTIPCCLPLKVMLPQQRFGGAGCQDLHTTRPRKASQCPRSPHQVAGMWGWGADGGDQPHRSISAHSSPAVPSPSISTVLQATFLSPLTLVPMDQGPGLCPWYLSFSRKGPYVQIHSHWDTSRWNWGELNSVYNSLKKRWVWWLSL